MLLSTRSSSCMNLTLLSWILLNYSYSAPPGLPSCLTSDWSAHTSPLCHALAYPPFNSATNDQSYQNTEVSILDFSTEIFKTLHYLTDLMCSIKNPPGTRDNPARICRDLLDCERKVADGTSSCLFCHIPAH